MSNDTPVLLITGCISPEKNQPHLCISNPKQRYEQYITSISFYIEKSLFKDIVFCESSNFYYPSNSGLVELAEKYHKNFEWICFSGNKKEVLNKGKGYGEGEIIEYAIGHSQIMIQASYFVKTTGRIVVKNVNKIGLKLNFRKNYFNFDLCRTCGIDTRFYCCTVDFYKKYLLNAYKRCSDYANEMSLEDVFYDCLIDAEKFYCLPDYPFFSGVGGSHGDIYDNENIMKRYICSALCRLSIFNRVYSFLALCFRKIRILFGYKKYRSRKGMVWNKKYL